MSKKTKITLCIAAAWCIPAWIIGLIAALLTDHEWASMLLGGGAGGGIVVIGYLIYYRFFPKHAREYERNTYDERGEKIQGKSALVSFYAMIAAILVALTAAMLLERYDYLVMITAFEAVIAVSYFAAYLYYRKKL